MSIFNTTPPVIDEIILFEWLVKNYNFLSSGIIHSKKLNSERDFNLKIVTKDKKEFVVKISNPSENYNILDMQDSMLNYLSTCKVKNSIPTPIHKKINKFNDIENRYCYVRILPFLKGDIFAHKQNNKKLCVNLSKFLGYLTLSLKDFKHKSAHREFIWNSINIDLVKKNIDLFSEQSKKNIIKMVIDSYDNNVRPMLSNIRYSVIHGDANNYNLLSFNDNIVGLLDYGDSIYAPTVCELTVALAYSLMNCSNITEKCCYMVKSYHSVYPLSKNEIECISTFIASRLSISVIMANMQKKKYPDNDYLSISNNDAWNLLIKLRDINLEELKYNLLKTCNYDS